MMLYNCFVRPHLMLHIEVWGAAPDCHLNKLSVRQNKLLRAILGVKTVNFVPVVPTTDMYKTLNILTIRNLFKFYMFKFLISLLNGFLPYFYDTLLQPLEVQHIYDTRNRRFYHPFITNEVVRRSVAPQLVKLYESVPPDILLCSTPIALKKYKGFLLDSQ